MSDSIFIYKDCITCSQLSRRNGDKLGKLIHASLLPSPCSQSSQLIGAQGVSSKKGNGTNGVGHGGRIVEACKRGVTPLENLVGEACGLQTKNYGSDHE